MRRPDLTGGLVALAAALILTGCGGQGVDAPDGPTSSTPTTSTSTEPETMATGSAPTHVSIETIGVDEELIDLGIAENGELDVPDDPARVGWFAGGGRPGGTGPTVVVGHVDSRSGPAVFADVPRLTPGDTISVTMQDDAVVDYTVSAVEDFPQKGGFPTEDVFGATATDELRLITCTGPYDEQAGRYTENRVVFAEPA